MFALAVVTGVAGGIARALGAGRDGRWAAEFAALTGLLVIWAVIDFFASRHLKRAIADSHDLYEQIRREQFGES